MFRRLLTFDEAKKAISKHLQTEPLGEQLVPLLEAHNHVLAENITSSLDIPPFNRSTVDGYAVKAEDTYGAEENNPIRLKICGVVNVGELPLLSIEKGGAAEIVTGAPIPEGADAVVMVEDTEKDDDGLRVYSAVAKDENVMKKGADIKRGVIILKAGQVLGSSEIGVIAALGLTKVKVFRAPVVAVLSTGGEVTEPGKDLPPGKIYDINAYSLSAAVLENGGKPVYLGVVPDDKTALRKALEDALSSADIVLTSGGVSVGPKDITPQTIDSLGKPGLVVCGVAVKPGKPITVAFAGRKPVFSMPGHPTSALLMFHLFVRPVIQLLSGRSVQEISAVKAFAGARMFSAKGRRTFVMVKLKRERANRLIAEPVETGASGAITTLAKADGFVEIPENQQFVEAEEEITVSLLRNVQGL
jgi:molybdenum cofactor synthesis domain-containing protein